MVSTHSRPKAAGSTRLRGRQDRRRFNTQPPEGGWGWTGTGYFEITGFNTQPPEGGWASRCPNNDVYVVSTHSRPKAAGKISLAQLKAAMFQHTAARRRLGTNTP